MHEVGLVYVENPQDDEGNVFNRPHELGSPSAVRLLGTYRVTSRYFGRGDVPLAAIRVTLIDGVVANGKMRTDRPGYLHLFARGKTP